MSYKILVINPGSTSTKIGVYEDETLLFEETLRHSTEEIAKYATIVDQKDFRKELIVDILAKNSFDIKSLNVVVGRGGLLKPIPGGTYPVSDALLADLKAGVQGQHASNLGGILAREIGDEIGVPAGMPLTKRQISGLICGAPVPLTDKLYWMEYLAAKENLLQDIPESRNFRVSVSSTH